MPRRGVAAKRDPAPDPRFGSRMVGHIISKLMVSGKKSTAQAIFYGCCDIIQERTHKEPMETIEQAVRNASPTVEVKPRRVGGATYQVPVEVSEDRRVSLAVRWLLQSAHSRSGKSMADKLAGELMDAAKNTGNTIKRRDDTHKMAEANRAFAHYRW